MLWQGKVDRHRFREAMERGVLAGYSLVGVAATLYDGSFHEVDSSEISFKVAGSMAFQDAAGKARPVLLEPVMDLEAVTPEEYVGDVISDLNSKRGKVTGIETEKEVQIVKDQFIIQ